MDGWYRDHHLNKDFAIKLVLRVVMHHVTTSQATMHFMCLPACRPSRRDLQECVHVVPAKTWIRNSNVPVMDLPRQASFAYAQNLQPGPIPQGFTGIVRNSLRRLETNHRLLGAFFMAAFFLFATFITLEGFLFAALAFLFLVGLRSIVGNGSIFSNSPFN